MKRLKYGSPFYTHYIDPFSFCSFGTTANGTSDGAGKWKQTKLNFGSFVATAGFGGGGPFATTSVMAPRLMKAEPGKKHIDIMVSCSEIAFLYELVLDQLSSIVNHDFIWNVVILAFVKIMNCS